MNTTPTGSRLEMGSSTRSFVSKTFCFFEKKTKSGNAGKDKKKFNVLGKDVSGQFSYTRGRDEV